MQGNTIPFYFVNQHLIDKIEKERNVKLNLRERHLIAITNSFNRLGRKCTLSRSTFEGLVCCKKKQLRSSFKRLVELKILKVHYPLNQSKTHETCTTHLHADVKEWAHELAEAGFKMNTEAGFKMNTNNKNIGKEESSFRNDSSFLPEEPELACLNFLAD